MQKITLYLCFLFILCCSHFLRSQNLVADSSFENNSFIPLSFSEIHASTSWNKPSQGTSDLFCKCSKKQMIYSMVNVPMNLMGTQYPHSGKCYGGFFAHSHGIYREYLQTSLKKPLERNKKYLFRMYISLADYSRMVIDQLGVCFLMSPAIYKNPNVIMNLDPVYMKIEEGFMKDTVGWQCMSVVYKANGGESCILIGSFEFDKYLKTKVKAPRSIRSRINQSTERDSYYYIDDVSITELPYDPLKEKADSIAAAKTIVTVPKEISGLFFNAKNILFASNEATLLSDAYSELDLLVIFLNAKTGVTLEISGHTDNTGTEDFNRKLSEERAKAVSDYIISKGVEHSRVNFKGYGSSKPVKSNETEEGKRENRRVEFVIRE